MLLLPITCFSLEGIKLLYEVSILESFEEVDSLYEKGLKQIEDSLAINPNLLNPRDALFKNTHKKSRRHYFIFKDTLNINIKRPVIALEKWQKALYELLCQVDLDHYYSVHEDEEMTKFLMKIKEVPEFFCVGSNKKSKVNLLIELLLTFIQDKHIISNKEMKEFSIILKEATSKYKLITNFLNDQTEKIEGEMARSIQRVDKMIKKQKLEIIPLLVSKAIICMKDAFPFIIQKGEEQSEEDNSVFILRVNKGTKKFTLSSDVYKRKGESLFRYYCIQSFIEVYGAIPNLVKLVPKNDNSGKLLELYKDFLIFVTHVVRNELKLPILSEEQKAKVIGYIERYLFRRLYPK